MDSEALALLREIKDIYADNIKGLVASRDELIKENKALIKENQSLIRQSTKCMDKITRLENEMKDARQEFKDYLKHQASQHTNNINVSK